MKLPSWMWWPWYIVNAWQTGRRIQISMFTDKKICPYCHGLGWLPHHTTLYPPHSECCRCDGRGFYDEALDRVLQGAKKTNR